MTVGQLPADAEGFARYLRELTALVGTGDGWCGVFWQRDPDGMRACLDGTALPPWDVLESLLQDLAAGHGAAAAERERVRARALHTAAATAHDRRPGGRETLAERLGATRREQAYAAERERELTRRLRASAGGSPGRGRGEGRGLDVELAWARDDHERATARCAELGARLAALDADATPPPSRGRAPAPESWFRAQAPGFAEAPEAWAAPSRDAGTSGRSFPHPAPSRTGGGPPDPRRPPGVSSNAGRAGYAAQQQHPGLPALEGRGPGAGSGGYAAQQDHPGLPAPEGRGGEGNSGTSPSRAPARKRRPRGARYAGLDDHDDDGGDVFAGPAVPQPPAQSVAPRGARYAGVEEEAAAAPPATGEDAAGHLEARRAVGRTVAVLVQLRAQGRTGEAHVLLCEAAGWPAARLPVLAGALHQAGLGADWATLLWEAASMPPGRVAAVAAALEGAGLGEDGRQLLRQGVVRPAPEIAAALLALEESGGHEREVRALAAAFVHVRTPEDVAQAARTDPRRLSPLLLDAARQMPQSRYRDIVHALRVAGAAP